MAEILVSSYSSFIVQDDWTFNSLKEVRMSSTQSNIARESKVSYKLEKIALSDLVKINPEKVSQKEIKVNELYKYLDLTSISSETGMVTEVKYVAGNDLPSRARLRVRAGDIILSTIRPERNTIAMVPNEADGCILNTTLVCLRPKGDIDGKFLYFILRSEDIRKRLSLKARGTTIPTLSVESIGNLELDLSLTFIKEKEEEVKEIYNKWIERNKFKLPLQTIIEDVFIEAQVVNNNIGRKNGEDNKKYTIYAYNKLLDRLDASFYLKEAYKNETLYTNPMKLEDIASKIKSGAPAIRSNLYVEEGVPLIRIKNLDEDSVFIQQNDIVHLDKELATRYFKNIVSTDNILISKIGSSIGKVGLVQPDMKGAIANQHLLIIEPNSRVLPEYLAYYLKTSWARKEFERKSGGSTQQFLKINSIKDISIPVPSLNVQKMIIERIRQIKSRQQIKIIEERIKNLFSTQQ